MGRYTENRLWCRIVFLLYSITGIMLTIMFRSTESLLPWLTMPAIVKVLVALLRVA